MLDRLPAWLRHIVIVFGGGFGAVVVDDVVNARGVTGLDWVHVLRTAVDAGAVAAAVAVGALYVTPLTRQYGVKK